MDALPLDQPRQPAPPTFQDPRVGMLWDAWHRWRGQNAFPGRRAVDPAAIGPILPEVFLVECTDDGRFRYRLAGETINRLFCRNLRGRLVEEALPPELAADTVRRFTRIAEAGVALHLAGYAYVQCGLRYPSERLLLPLAEDGATVDGIIGVSLFYDDAAGDDLRLRTPLWDDPVVTAIELVPASAAA